MIKQIIILFNIISVVGFNFFTEDKVTLVVNAPEAVNPGSTFQVEITINKGDIDGFAKFQQELPTGLTAEKENTGNATFSFKDQQLKCIWMSIPEEESFKIKYKVKVAPDMMGEYKIDGNFAYIENNEKKSIVVPTINITIGKERPMPVVSQPMATPKEAPKRTTAKRDPENGVLCMRTTSPIKGKQEEFKVEVKIQSNKEGFAKLEEFIPDGFVASEIESMDGLFSFKNHTVKIIWMSLPKQSEFIIAYKLVADKSVTGNNITTGNFVYIEGNVTKKFNLTKSTIFIERDENGESTIIIDDEGGTFTEKDKKSQILAEFTMPKPEDDDDVKTFESEEPAPPAKKEEPIAKTPEPESDITYKVQVAAGHKSVPGNYFEKKHSLKEKISIENHEGWIKYTVGSFNNYKSGRDYRNEMWNSYKISDAFVTAYNYGQRITVQEALMISNQKWYN